MTATARKVGGSAGNRGKGRKPGVPNKATASVKAAFLEAFERRGGVAALVAWSKEEPTEFYKLAAKLIPHEITGKDGNAIEIAQVWRFGNREVQF